MGGREPENHLSGGGTFPIATGRTSKITEEDFGRGCQQLMQNKKSGEEPQNSSTV